MQDGGTDVASSVATEAGREAIFRQGISSTIKVTADGSGVAASALARSFKPRDFVCGLAIALGVSEARAIKMVHAVIAADARGRLLDVSASRRKGELQDAAAGIQALVRILEAFPLPTSAAEASLVGAALRDKITLAETEDLLKQLVCLKKSVHSIILLFSACGGVRLVVATRSLAWKCVVILPCSAGFRCTRDDGAVHGHAWV